MRNSSISLENNLTSLKLTLMRRPHVPDQPIFTTNHPTAVKSRMHCKCCRLELLAVELLGMTMLEIVIDCEENTVGAKGADLSK